MNRCIYCACALLVFLVLGSATGAQSIELRDNLSDPTNFNPPTRENTRNKLDDVPFATSADAVIGISFVGNGQNLTAIEAIFQGERTGGLGTSIGEIQIADWLVGVYHDPARFSVEGVKGLPLSDPPDFVIRLADPSNSNYITPVGSDSGVDNYHAVFDVSAENFTTIDGQPHVAFLVPIAPPGNNLAAWLSVSNDLGSTTGLGLDLLDFALDIDPASTLQGTGVPYDNVAARVSAVAYPTTASTFVVRTGTLQSGSEVELSASDNVDVRVSRNRTSLRSRVVYEVSTTSPVASPGAMTITIEESVFSKPTISRTIELFNHSTGVFEQVDVRDAPRLTDRVDEITVTGDPSRFVHSGTLQMTARVRYDGPLDRTNFIVNADQFFWRVGN